MPGPAPSPNARRRNDRDAWRTVPYRCTIAAPAWPVPGRKPAGLVDLWRHLWSLPVAAIWHEQDATRLVARYALLVLHAESNLTDPRPAAECRQIEDRLLISPSTRIRARVVVEDAPPTVRGQNVGEVAELDDARARRLNRR